MTPGNNARPGSNARPGGNNIRSGSNSKERPKGELFKKVEMIEVKFEQFEKEIKEMLKNKLVDTQFVEEEFIIDVKYVNTGAKKMILIDSDAPKSIVSSKWLEEYLREVKVNGDEARRKKCARRFRMGKMVYLS